MARIKSRCCDFCGTLHSGRGDKFHNRKCLGKANQGLSVLALADAHTDPHKPIHPSLQVARHFCREVKPDMLIVGGDWFTFDTLASFNTNRSRVAEGLRYRRELDHGVALLEQFAKLVPRGKVFLGGNHEDRVRLWP